MSEKTRFTEYVHVENFELYAHIGVPEDERASLQRLLCNVTFWPLRSMTALEDDISRAVDYAQVCTKIEQFVRSRSDKLIETLVDALAARLLATYEIAKVTVELRKFVVPRTEFVSVTITRSAGSSEPGA